MIINEANVSPINGRKPVIDEMIEKKIPTKIRLMPLLPSLSIALAPLNFNNPMISMTKTTLKTTLANTPTNGMRSKTEATTPYIAAILRLLQFYCLVLSC